MNAKAKLDFSSLPLVDSHCHFFEITYKPHDLAAVLNMSLNAMPSEQLHHTLIYRRVVKTLRDFLGMENRTDEELLHARRQTDP